MIEFFRMEARGIFMYHVILFDLDGTLTDSKEGILNCLRYAFQKLGQPVPDEATLLKFIGPPLQDTFMELGGLSKEQAMAGVEAFRERYEPIGKLENAAAPGLPELCARLKEAGYTLALSSSKPEHLCLDICERFGYAPSLTAIVGSPLHGDHTKADVIRDTLGRLGLTDADKPSILMVGDRKYDVLGAKECGIDCVGVEFFGYASPGELWDAGAVAVVQTAAELESYIRSH
ncbi:5'-nucleotidase [anaerobic digester metagenome]